MAVSGSVSEASAGALAGGSAGVAGAAAGSGTELIIWAGAPLLVSRLILSLKFSSSTSNSDRSDFFIKSTICLIAFISKALWELKLLNVSGGNVAQRPIRDRRRSCSTMVSYVFLTYARNGQGRAVNP